MSPSVPRYVILFHRSTKRAVNCYCLEMHSLSQVNTLSNCEQVERFLKTLPSHWRNKNKIKSE